MLSEATQNFTFYCPQHQLRFRAAGDSVVSCEQGGHSIGSGFPAEAWWQYCCDCATFWPAEVTNGFLRRSECFVCERPTAKQYLCPSCQVISIESAVPVRRKLYSITPENGIVPSCPGCATHLASAPTEHQCPEIGVLILTTRRDCPFCESLVNPKSTSVTKQFAKSCVFCGTPGKAGIRFCGKCGRPQPEAKLAEQEKWSGASSQDLPAPSSSYAAQDTTAESSVLNERQAPDTGAAEAAYDDRGIHIGAPWQSVLQAAPRKRNIPWLPVTVAVGVTVVAVTAFAIVFGPKRPLPVALLPTPPSGMVYVPGGEFRMGNDLGDEHERPAHMVAVRPFFLDQHEVACSDYERFVKATNHRPPPGWIKSNCPSGAHQKPVTGVDWYDANAYAQWIGKRLPTEEEWEFAARGTDGRLYPWGNEWRNNFANAGDSTAGHFTNVGSYPDGRSPFGVRDMIGNAWEWTASELRAYPGGQAPDQTQAELRVIRGGYWGSTPGKATATFRKGWDARGALGGYANTGFRCAKDL